MSIGASTLLKSAMAGGMAALTAAAETRALSDLEAKVAGVVIPGIILGLLGGAVAAVLPWGEKDWGVFAALRAIFLGVMAGSLSALVLMNVALSDGIKYLIAFIAGVLALKIFRWLANVDVGTMISDYLRRPRFPAPPPEPPPKPPGAPP